MICKLYRFYLRTLLKLPKEKTFKKKMYATIFPLHLLEKKKIENRKWSFLYKGKIFEINSIKFYI